MLSGEEIARMQRSATSRALSMKLEPYVVWPEDLEVLQRGEMPKGMSIPYLGRYVPQGWEKVRDLFVDSSGWGAPDEPAMTQEEFFRQMKVDHGYGITEAGEFQVYVGEYVRVSDEQEV